MAGMGVVFDELSFLQHDGRSGHRRSAPRRGEGCGGVWFSCGMALANPIFISNWTRMSNSIAWGSMDLPPFRQAVAMLADSWNSR